MRPSHFISLALTVAGSAVMGVLPTIAVAAASLQQQIQTAYDTRDAALNHFDIEGYLASYNGNYKNVTGGGKAGTTDRERQGVISDFQHALGLTRHETVSSVTPYGDGVTVLTTAVTSRMVKDPKTGRMTRRVDTDQDRAFWVHTKMGWRIKQERTLSRQQSLGGKSGA